jgi:hypothetical protein
VIRASRSNPALLLPALLLVAACDSAETQDCVTYYQPNTRVVGTLARETFPGRPQYESVAGGDEPETGFYLHLAAPICGRPSPKAGDARSDASLAPQDSVTALQLLLDSAGYAALRPYLGKSIALEGKAFAWITGHHHARVLLDVDKPVKVVTP